MTLLDIATYACRKINQTDAGDFVAAKSFAQQQFKLIWQSQLWKDSLVAFTQSLGTAANYSLTDTWLPTKQILLCPTIISHVIAVRNAERKFNIQSAEFFYCKDFDDFQNSGRAVDYQLLAPCVWEWDSAQTLYRRVLNPVDVAAAVTLDVFHPTTNIVERVTVPSLGSIDRIDTFTKAITTSDVAVGQTFTVTNTDRAEVGQQSGFQVGSSPAAGVQFDTVLNQGESATLDVNEGDVIYMSPQATGGGQVFAETVSASDSGQTITSPFGALSFDSDDTTRTFVAATPLLTAAAADTAVAKRQRIQLIGNLETGIVLRVLGKRTCPTFSADSDEPGLTGVDNVLMALVHGDMLERERRYGQAKLIFDKAGVMMDVLVKEQTVQQAHQKRIIPQDGFGNPYGFDGLLGTKSNPT